MDAEYSMRFEMVAGCLARGGLRRTIEAIAHHEHLLCDIDERKGFLESLLMVELQGDEDALHRARKLLANYLRKQFVTSF